MAFAGTQRPPLRWHHAETELDDFAIITYRVPTEGLGRHLPAGFAPRVFTFDDGEPASLVSAVVFRDRDFHFRFFPPASITCGQINYRAYVTEQDRPGVWFFGTSLDHPLVVVPRLLWGMPWTRSRIAITADWTASPHTWRLGVTDRAGDSHCEAVAKDPSDRLDGFADRDEWLRVLTHPTIGWYRRRSGGVGSYSIWHQPMAPRILQAQSARFVVFERLGLTTSDTRPHSVLAQPSLHFDVHTPPRRLTTRAETSQRVPG
jgi:hypothetical protein